MICFYSGCHWLFISCHGDWIYWEYHIIPFCAIFLIPFKLVRGMEWTPTLCLKVLNKCQASGLVKNQLFVDRNDCGECQEFRTATLSSVPLYIGAFHFCFRCKQVVVWSWRRRDGGGSDPSFSSQGLYTTFFPQWLRLCNGQHQWEALRYSSSQY